MEDLNIYERVRVLSLRTLQIACGAPIMIKTDEIDPYKIAKKEFEKKKIPYIVIRRYPDGKVEEIKIFK